MAKLDWDKAARRDRMREDAAYRYHEAASERAAQRQNRRRRKLAAFVAKHNLSCFKCHRSTGVQWAKTGINDRGAWAICTSCVETRRDVA